MFQIQSRQEIGARCRKLLEHAIEKLRHAIDSAGISFVYENLAGTSLSLSFSFFLSLSLSLYLSLSIYTYIYPPL